MLFNTNYEDWKRRFALIRRKHPDRPVRVYEAPDSFVLFISDDDDGFNACEKKKRSFRSREEELDFRNEILRGAIRLESNPLPLTEEDVLDAETEEISVLEPSDSLGDVPVGPPFAKR